jgi:hypothetical protein
MVIVLLMCLVLFQAWSLAGEEPKNRVIVLTDISNEPDDEQSMVRFLVYSNEYDVEGIVATTSTWLRKTNRLDLIQRQIEAYGKVRGNLLKHAPGFPTAEHLLSVAKAGSREYGMAGVGEGKATDGSKHIIAVLDKPDPRPVWISVWGGANTLAQALWDIRQSRSETDLRQFVRKLRVYTISDQDDTGRWLRINFPDLSYIVSPSNDDWKEYWRATWTGISGDRHYRNGPMHKFHLVDNPWLEENVINNHGPLGALYPKTAYIMEGDTPAFLGLIRNGLGWHASPAYGGWGGRYLLYQSYAETRPIWTNNQDTRDTVVAEDGQTYISDQATIWRWREAYQHDFAARMDWCVADEYAKANHNPIAVLNGDATKALLELNARPGETVALSAAGSKDPDGHDIDTHWFVYREAGTFNNEVRLTASSGEKTSFVAPAVKQPATIHVILQLKDGGNPPLFSYRRAIVTVRP